MSALKPSTPGKAEGLQSSTAPAPAPVYQPPVKLPRQPRVDEAIQLGRIVLVRTVSGVVVREGSSTIKEARKGLDRVFQEMVAVREARKA